jgi:hypothetical protein
VTLLAPLRGVLGPLGVGQIRQSYRDMVLADGALGYWRLGESAGTVAANEVSGGEVGTYAGSGWTKGVASLLTGDSDTSVVSTGAANNGITLPGSTSLNRASATVECWIKTNAPGTGYRGLVVGSNTIGLYLKASILIAFDMGGGADRSSGVNVADNVRHHIVYIFQSAMANSSELWIDGTRIVTFTASLGGVISNVVIGSGTNPPTSQNYAGTIDEVAIYPTVLTPTQILAHYNKGAGLS